MGFVFQEDGCLEQCSANCLASYLASPWAHGCGSLLWLLWKGRCSWLHTNTMKFLLYNITSIHLQKRQIDVGIVHFNRVQQENIPITEESVFILASNMGKDYQSV